LNVTLTANQMRHVRQIRMCSSVKHRPGCWMRDSVHANTVYTGDPVYSRHFVASRINAPAAVVAVVFTLDHIVTTQTTMGWTKSLQYLFHRLP